MLEIVSVQDEEFSQDFFFYVYVRREALKKDRNKGANLSLRCYKPGRNVLKTVQTKLFQL